jgi:outer membrane protein
MKTITQGLGSIAAALLLLVSCTSPLQRNSEEQLREQLLGSYRQQLRAVAGGPVIQMSRATSDVEEELTDERRAELDQISGMGAYANETIELGLDLLGSNKPQAVAMALQQTIALAVEHNLNMAVARIRPAIARSQIAQAEAAFDATVFSNIDYSLLDTPQPSGAVAGLVGNIRSETFAWETGIRKSLRSGGEVTASTTIGRRERTPSVFATTSFFDNDLMLQWTFPLLRGFGTDVNRVVIVLSRNAEQSALQDLRGDLITVIANTESAYWNLVFAKQHLLIRSRLLARTIEDRDRLKQRRDFDLSPVRLTEANSFVELRRAEVIRARQAVRLASDALKQLIHSPDLPVASEVLILPTDQPIDQPISFSLLDAVTTAMRYRPDLQSALVAIKDASVRQRVADNARLPQLNLIATATANGISGNDDFDAYGNLGDMNFIDYLLGAQFEMPLGNRGPEAAFTQRRLERRAAVTAYQELAQQVVFEVKNALRDLLTSYELIAATHAARLSAADSLRAIEEQEAAGVALTPEFLLDLKLSTQARLADTETQEVQALTDYNNAIAAWYRSMGTLLKRNGIEFHHQP